MKLFSFFILYSGLAQTLTIVALRNRPDLSLTKCQKVCRDGTANIIYYRYEKL